MSSPAFFYGKLPNFSDFIRYNAGGSEVRALDRWLQEGLYAAAHYFGQDWNGAYERAPAYHFVFSPEDAGVLLVGILQPSRDKSERKYPFCVALKKEKRTFEEKTVPLIPLIFDLFFEESREIIQLGMEGFPLSNLAERIDDLKTSVEENLEASHRSFREYLAGTTQELFWSGLFGSFHDPKKFLVVHNIIEIFQPDSPYTPRSSKVCIRFPLSGQEPCSIQEVCFWVQMCSRLLGDNLFYPHLFWKVHGKNGKDFLFLFPGKVQARNFIQLVDPDAENDSVWKLDEEGAEKLARLDFRIPAGYSDLLARGELTLAEVLREIGRFPGKGKDFD
jgi:type VI secretion system ImpM family protein